MTALAAKECLEVAGHKKARSSASLNRAAKNGGTVWLQPILNQSSIVRQSLDDLNIYGLGALFGLT